MLAKEDVFEILSTVMDPDLHLPILDMGLIYDVELKEDSITVVYTLTSPACPVGDLIHQDIVNTLRAATDYPLIEARLVWNPPWHQNMMSDELKMNFGFEIS